MLIVKVLSIVGQHLGEMQFLLPHTSVGLAHKPIDMMDVAALHSATLV